MKVNLYSLKQKNTSSLSLPKELTEAVNEPLLAQALLVYRDRLHKGTSKTKTRADVNLTKSKWFRQKGTGRARHGAKSAPIFVGGGVAHGPKGVKRTLVLPSKMKKKALLSAFCLKAKNGQVAAADLTDVKKTRQAQELLGKIYDGEKAKAGSKVTFAVSDKNSEVATFIKNIPNAKVVRYKDLNAYRVYFAGKLVIDVDVFAKENKKEKNK